MITPLFSVRQDEEFIYITIQAPHIKAKEIDFYVSGNQFRFHAKPYFLRLTFDNPLAEETGNEKANYDYGTGVCIVTLAKLEKGKFFEGLDMLTKLLEKKKQNTGAIEELGKFIKISQPTTDSHKEENEEEEDVDWEIEQNLPTQLSADELLKKPHYGFNNQYVSYFQPLQEDLKEIVDISEPDSISASERQGKRIEHENSKFDGEHYMMDFIFDDEIQEVLKYECVWISEFKKKKILKKQRKEKNSIEKVQEKLENLNVNKTEVQSTDRANLSPASLVDIALSNSQNIPNKRYEKQKIEEEIIPFTTDHKELLLRLPKRSHLIQNEKAILLGLLDILYCFTLNAIITIGENTVVSPWTICKVSPTLSWLVEFQTVKQTIVACVRRSLIFPLYRHWEISMKTLACTLVLLKLGKRAILRTLLDLKKLLDKSEFHFHLNRLFIDDYCLYVQSVNRTKLKSLAKEVSRVSITKEEIGWNLEELENQAIEKVSQMPDEEVGD